MAKTNNQPKRPKNRKTKSVLVFDAEKRKYVYFFKNESIRFFFNDLTSRFLNFREFLTGFHKRKLQRKKKAQQKLEQDLKEERKRLKAEVNCKTYSAVNEIFLLI